MPIYKLINQQRLLAVREGCPARESEENFDTWIDSIVITKLNKRGQEEITFPE
ncbi:hypothetical protein VDG1235_2310 [Verrucomicrobiia bacterium DG1235]|nr:hypothetical protein VDG1235_2310 [Verrucomicrobiae bacterium DG1235]